MPIYVSVLAGDVWDGKAKWSGRFRCGAPCRSWWKYR